MTISAKQGRNLIVLFLLIIVLLLSAYLTIKNDPRVADYILLNGDIVTMDVSRPSAQAVATKGDKIIAVGSADELSKLKGFTTQTIDLNGQTLMPGFIEPHTHPIAAAILANWVDVSGFNNPTPKDVFDKIANAVQQSNPGEPVLAFGLDPLLTPGLIPPDKAVLDRLAPNNPVFVLSQVMHTSYVNSLALKAAGIDANTIDPEGGHYERGPDGEPSGIAHEEAVATLLVRPQQNIFQKLKAGLQVRSDLIKQYQRYAKHGYTTIGSPGPVPMFEGYLEMLEHVATRSNSPIRSYVYPLASEIDKTNYTPGYTNGRYQVLGVKFHIDGSPWTGGMATDQAYLMNDFTQGVLHMKRGNRGQLKHSVENLNAQVKKYHDAGWQISAHAHGERAHEMILNSIESAQRTSPREDARHRLEHLGLIGKDDIQRAAQLGVTLSFFIDHISFFGDSIEQTLLGPQRAERFMPLKWATDLHDNVTIHIDTPSAPLGIMRALKTAVTRTPRFNTTPLNTSQQMSIQDALEAVTIDAAWQLHAEQQIGSIEVGKYADFTILSKNPTKVEPQLWESIIIRGTWMDGKAFSL